MNWSRFLAILIKEFRQIRRDRLTFAMMVGVPIMQLVLFGFAINTDPKQLPMAVVSADESEFSRSLIAGLENSQYFRVTQRPRSEAEGNRLLDEGRVQFLLVVPPDFSRQLVRGERPALLLAADATDPSASGNALAAVNSIARQAVGRDLTGPLHALQPVDAPFEIRPQRRYNPEGVSRYNIVPGLIGVVLTMTMVMMTSLAMTRERERGTMENLLATPVRPLEVMVGKIAPYILIGYVQVVVILIAARLLFDVPMVGSLALLSAALVVFMAANLAVGFTFSTVARNQLQAMQLTFFFFLPSMLLSGFMFPFRGMPGWAQVIGEMLPLTHFLRVVRGIMLKGNGVVEVLPNVWPMGVFMLVAGLVALKRYRQTLD
ncbi:ABC transporter permease [Noviherbaspirillum denitrificans]|uniref:Mannose-1-phosphate guanyltransferase n=1 Tax=Noviherbaspirillum denitrificans TaxID=1968433 RepID=A0A254TJ36_9BURK|nr:ABC transporter permease [Noviherbaspirillum denitrificans]OWW22641.1 mannose-1-phosphate guanyltransferase [Noviherbaspirillum denitrificans]